MSPEHYLDRFGNLILGLCHNDLNEIVVNDDNFEQWIKERYPKYHFISSTTKCLSKPNELVSELEKEDYTFLDDDRIDYYNNGECCVVEVLVNAIIECGKVIFKLFK